jgi:pilus assembly protein CpaB
MNTARIVVLTIARSAGGVAASLARGSDNRSPPARPVARQQTVDVLVAGSATWPATAASHSFIRRHERPAATTEAGRQYQRGWLRNLDADTEVTEGRPI